MTKQMSNFTATLRMFFVVVVLLRSKSTSESLKAVFDVFKRKPSLGAPGEYHNVITASYGVTYYRISSIPSAAITEKPGW